MTTIVWRHQTLHYGPDHPLMLSALSPLSLHHSIWCTSITSCTAWLNHLCQWRSQYFGDTNRCTTEPTNPWLDPFHIHNILSHFPTPYIFYRLLAQNDDVFHIKTFMKILRRLTSYYHPSLQIPRYQTHWNTPWPVLQTYWAPPHLDRLTADFTENFAGGGERHMLFTDMRRVNHVALICPIVIILVCTVRNWV